MWSRGVSPSSRRVSPGVASPPAIYVCPSSWPRARRALGEFISESYLMTALWIFLTFFMMVDRYRAVS